jgi:hypothetical protein
MKKNYHNKQLCRDMQEEPDKYSDQEIEEMMDDLDQMPDVDEAWQQFTWQHIPSERPIHTWRKIAAILIGILALSGIAIAAVQMMRQSQHEEQPVTAVEKPQSAIIVSQTLPADTIVKTEPVVFDNVPLDSIAKDIATYHHLEVDLQNERQRVGASAGMQASQLRFYFVWNQEESLQEVIEKLNMFEHVNMAVENGKLIVR